MNTQNLQEHAIKEMLKKAVDNNPRFSNTVKCELKIIIDTSNTQAELTQKVMAYLFGISLF